jgi:subtilisin-like proprotein convertase family protein
MWGDNSGGSAYSLLEGFRYGSVAFMNEKSNGEWKLKISDIVDGSSGKITKLEFEVFGH